MFLLTYVHKCCNFVCSIIWWKHLHYLTLPILTSDTRLNLWEKKHLKQELFAPHYTCTDADDIQQVSLWCPTHNTGSMCLPSPVYLWEKLWKHNVLENQQSNQSWTNVQRAWQQYGYLHQSFIHLSTRRHCLQHDQSPIHSDDRKLQKRARPHVYNIHFRTIIKN